MCVVGVYPQVGWTTSRWMTLPVWDHLPRCYTRRLAVRRKGTRPLSWTSRLLRLVRAGPSAWWDSRVWALLRRARPCRAHHGTLQRCCCLRLTARRQARTTSWTGRRTKLLHCLRKVRVHESHWQIAAWCFLWRHLLTGLCVSLQIWTRQTFIRRYVRARRFAFLVFRIDEQPRA